MREIIVVDSNEKRHIVYVKPGKILPGGNLGLSEYRLNNPDNGPCIIPTEKGKESDFKNLETGEILKTIE